ncbi:MAG: ATP-binding protein [Bacillota bacterium]|nr:ATP-binding protein [Bacillota bacterium]
MTEAELLEIIARGESFTVEFKGEARQPLSDRDLVETVVCLANGEGGLLLIGVEDDGTVTGPRPRHEGGVTDPRRVQALIANQTRPSLAARVYEVTVGGKTVLVIDVPRSALPVGTTEGKYLRRAIGGRGEAACVPYHFHEMQARLANGGAQDYSALRVPGATWDDLDPLEFERFRRFVRESVGLGDRSLVALPDLEIAKALGLVEANHEVRALRVGALLLFGKQEALRRYVPTHEVAFQVLSDTRVEVNDFFRWPLLRVTDEIMTRFRARNSQEEIILGLVRLGIPDYSEEGFREALANAILHRDYTRLGAVHVQWEKDRIRISNPGGFPEGIRLDNLLVAPPRPRNPLLVDAFKRAGVVERTGRGIDLIFESQLRYGRPAPDYGLSTATDVTVILPGGPANLQLARFVAEQSLRGRPLSVEDLLILNEIERSRSLDVKRAAELIQRSETAARAHLNQMVERGFLEARGERKVSYHLSAALYRALGEPAQYVRARGFEPIQHEQMVLQYVRKHGSISRKEVSELCQLPPPQAYRLLKRLTQRGELRMVGKGRTATYRPTRTQK